MAPPADQKSIDLAELQRATLQQSRTESLVPMKYDAGMDPNMGLFDRIGEKAGQELATVAANLPSWSNAGQMRPFATDAEVEARRDQPVENALQTYLAPALHMPEAILVGSSLGGGVPGWISSARSNGAPAASATNRAFSGIGRQPDGTQPSPTLDTLYPGPAIAQPSQPTSLFPSTTAGNGWTPQLTPFAPGPMQPATTPSGLRVADSRCSPRRVGLSSRCEVTARESAPLKIAERMPETVRKPMPAVSDMEINLRFNVPDGLETSGEWPYKYVTATTDEHDNPSESPIRRERGE
jgi:hypothetical protein